jgi:hypothetical protein
MTLLLSPQTKPCPPLGTDTAHAHKSPARTAAQSPQCCHWPAGCNNRDKHIMETDWASKHAAYNRPKHLSAGAELAPTNSRRAAAAAAKSLPASLMMALLP